MARIVQVMIIIFVSLSLTACGGGGGGEGPSASSANTTGNSGGSKSEPNNPAPSDDPIPDESDGSPAPTPIPPSGNASATINWAAPTTRENGSAIAMSELNGYKIYYGTSSTSQNNVVTVTNSSQFSYQFNNLTSGTVYYFRVTAYDMNNSESQLSNMVTRTAS